MSALVGMLLAATTCPQGQAVNADTAGHCCWSSQVWSKLQGRCVGVPACPVGTQAQGETCVTSCAPGQQVSEDTAGRCCWPNQVWSSSRNLCVGIPACPAGMVTSGESCAPGAPSAQQPPPPPQYPQSPQYQQQQPPPPQYQQPPQYGQPPQDAPRATADRRTELQASLLDLRQRHARMGFGSEIVMLVLGIPALSLGLGLAYAGISSDNVPVGVLGLALTAAGVTFTLIGGLGIPAKARARGRLSNEIKATEAELHALDVRARLFLGTGSGPLLFALSSPVFSF